MRFVAYVFWLFITILGITFAMLNSHSVKINYYINSVNIYLPLLLLILLVIGAVLGLMAILPRWIRVQHANRKLKRKLKSLEQEVNNLRAIPIKDSH